MFVGSPLSSNPTSPIPMHSPSPDGQSGSLSPFLLPHSIPCWATQARCDLAQAEAELRQLQERHVIEIESVKRGVERAILGAHREERRLLERVEQDHRDTQQRLEQVQRENMAAARVSQSLLDQRLCKLAQLQHQIQALGEESGVDQSVPNHNLLLKDVSEFLQPWEISVSLKKVTFKPSSQPNAVTFGDIRVHEKSLSLHVGGCGPQGQMCALHSQEIQCEDTNHQVPGGKKGTPGQGWTTPTGRVVRKISLSTRSDMKSEEEQRLSSAKICHWLPKCEQSDWDSSQDDELESTLFHSQGEDVFLAVPTIHKSVEIEGKERKINSNVKHSPKNSRKSLTVVSSRKLSPSPERRRGHTKLSHCLSLDRHKENKGKWSQDSNSRVLRYSNSVVTSPRMTSREPLISQSCLDLTSRGRPHSRLSQSSDEHSLGTLGDSGRAPSPTDSLDSSYTFIVSSSQDYRGSVNYNYRRSKSAVDLTHKTHPLTNYSTNEQARAWRVKCSDFNSMSPTLSRGPRVFDMGPYTTYRGLNAQKQPQKESTKPPIVARSLSMSVIDGSSREPSRARGEPALMELEEEADMTVVNPRGVHLIRQFGKQGSGRADLTLPSGIHATPQGQLFIVDCGNARVQVGVFTAYLDHYRKFMFHV